MLQKAILFTLLLISSALSFAQAKNNTLSVEPYNPSAWGYMAGTVYINGAPYGIGEQVIVPVSMNDRIGLVVYAMNVNPRLSASCVGLQVNTEGPHQLLFELQPDWLIHCRYV